MKILLVHKGLQSFTKQEYEILKKEHEVVEWKYDVRKLYKLALLTKWSDLTYSYFGSDHAFFAVLFSKLFGKKSIVMAGGYEAANVPEIPYGLMGHPLKKILAKFAMTKCDHVIAVTEKTKKDLLKHCTPKKLSIVQNGIDPKRFNIKNIKKENLIITYGGVNKQTYHRKGIKYFAEVSKRFPDYKFMVIGKVDDDMYERLTFDMGTNENITGWVSDKELETYMQVAKLNCQLSIYESFGMTIPECMLVGTPSVVTKGCGALELFEEDVTVVKNMTLNSMEKAIRQALRKKHNPEKLREIAIKKAHRDIRAKKVLDIVRNFVPTR